MPLAQQLLLAVLAAFAVTALLILASKRRPNETLGDEADLDSSYRDGPTMHYDPPPRLTGKRRELAMGYGKRFQSNVPDIVLTPRHLEHINILRRRYDKPPMNAAGFRAAIARQATATVPVPVRSSDDWVLYLIAYEVLSGDHQQHRVSVDASITVAPNEPFNGQGGQYAGAGASADWTAPDTAPGGSSLRIGAAAALGASLGAFDSDSATAQPAADPQPDPAPQAAPEATSYQAPDPPASGDAGGGGVSSD